VEVLALWLSEVSPYKRSPVQDHQAIMIGRLIVILIWLLSFPLTPLSCHVKHIVRLLCAFEGRDIVIICAKEGVYYSNYVLATCGGKSLSC
jgi:hypothetical protein